MTGPAKLDTRTIVIVVCVAIVPVVIFVGVAIWLLGFYGRKRLCCCGRQKKEADPEAAKEFKWRADLETKRLSQESPTTVPVPETSSPQPSPNSSTFDRAVIRHPSVFV
jgi:hypothetical protein